MHIPNPHFATRRRLDQTGFALRYVLFISLILVAATIFRSVHGHALSTSSPIKSGVVGYCLDDRHDSLVANTALDIWKCNGSAAQDWAITKGTITHDTKYCLSVENDAKVAGGAVVLNDCDNSPGQVWLSNHNGFENPNSGLCLTAPDSSDKSNPQIVISSCSNLSQASKTWTASNSDANEPCSGTQGQKIACTAEKQWTIWQSGTPSHNTLLTQYTDDTPYEEWCADFVSYIYKQAGYPFTAGETDGWNENIAGNVQNMGFTMHPAGSYQPKPGDVAYFDYAGGHVEIVVSGGKTPTFVYGNSGQIDPTTGNGQMQANTITSEGALGNLEYYLSPNGA